MTNLNMPTMPTPGSNKEENVKTSLPGELDITPEAEVVEKPAQDDEKPDYVDPEKNDSVIDIPEFPKTGIKVVATQKGFYNQKRINPGEEFTVKTKKRLGSWMKCLDPAIEKKRVEFFKNKKAKK